MASTWQQQYEAKCAAMDEWRARMSVALGLPHDHGDKFGWVGLEAEAMRLRETADKARAGEVSNG